MNTTGTRRPVETARTLLFVPGSRPDRFGKAVAAGADEVILDLEDAVSGPEKPAARQWVRDWLRGTGAAAVRINAGPEQADDLSALAGVPGLTAVVVAKAEDPDVLQLVGDRLGVPVLALIESARGVARAREVAAAPAVARLAIGTVDLALDLGAEEAWEPLLSARAELVIASRLAGLSGPVDGVSAGLDDEREVFTATERARALGFTGKLCVHPRQIPPVHRALRPSADRVAWARQVLAATDTGSSAARVGAEMVDLPVRLRAERILAAHRAAVGEAR
ncbi:CoA ester lyase [Micromonospora sp. RTGN7]|uniref:HpcH/HpaI aldolase/citrate lyase family protein n=1 Tax=Micromonospora sp. RTGN7 TaxID=3016526 RepID=UPI0029FF01C2|nr:CoA ester lyase [Micromonospora sp. RTGN7]